MTSTLHDLDHALDLCENGQVEDADLAYQRLSASEPAAAEALERLGRLASRLGRAKEATLWFTRAVAAEATAERLEALGEAQLAERGFEAALTSFARAARMDGARITAWLGLGEAAREFGRFAEAVEAYGEATRRDPRRIDGWIGQGLALVNADRVEQGLAACGTALALDPASAPASRALALALLRAGRLDEALAAAEAALARTPGYPEGRATLALVLMMAGRLEEARAHFAAAIEAKPTMAEAMTNHATLLARMGRDQDALREAARAGLLKPFLPAPFNLLGTLMRRTGMLHEAISAYQYLLQVHPANLEARANLADIQRVMGDAKAAVDTCLAGLETSPDHVGLLANLGAALQELGDVEGALSAYGRVLDLAPGQGEVENNIARLHQEAGNSDLAIKHLFKAVAGLPHDGELAARLVALLVEAERAEEAMAVASAAFTRTQLPGLALQFARLADRAGRMSLAESALRAAIAVAPEAADPYLAASALLLRAGARPRAIAYCRRAIRLAPDNARAWGMFAQALHGLRLGPGDRALGLDILVAMRQPGAENAYLATAATSLIELNPAMASLRAAANAADTDSAIAAWLAERGSVAVARDRLLRALLDTTIVTDPVLEWLLILVRRGLLACLEVGGITALDHQDWLPFICALANQCFLNEYLYTETPQETAAVDRLEAALDASVAKFQPPLPSHLALYGAYRPIVRWSGMRRVMSRTNWPEPVTDLLLHHVREPVTEELIVKNVQRLTAVDDAVSRAVRAQYEENPYPRWRDAGLLDAPMPVPQVLRAILAHVSLPAHPCWDAPEVLVAGCGTGRESVWAANQLAGAKVTAIDLSLTSLAYAIRQSERLKLPPIAYGQADILGLAGWGRRFDVIQCVGVLHHLSDPVAGWRVLTGLLRPHGVMKIGLYSAAARTIVDMARAFIAERGYGPNLADIRRLRDDVLALPAGHPLGPLVTSPDFYNASACRDLLFHVQEHFYRLPDIAALLDELGLEFLGFQFEDPTIARLYRERFPEDPTMRSLAQWDLFEADNPMTFAGLYQFWVRPADRAGVSS